MDRPVVPIVPVVPPSVWLLAAVDPVLVLVAVVLGWRADQFGKVFIAAIAALGLSVLVAWAVTALGLPWPAPVGRDLPTLFPVRTAGAFAWAAAAYAARRLAGLNRRSGREPEERAGPGGRPGGRDP